MLALLPVSMAVKTDVTAAEIISDAEETDPVESGEEATSAEETIPAVSGEETVLAEETDPAESGEETILPEETDPVENGEETVLAEEVDLPEEEQEIPAAGDTEAAAAVPAEAEDEIAGEEETVSNAGAAALMESMVETQLYDRIHYISLDDYYAASDSILIESNGHFGLVDTSHPSWDQDPRISGYTVDVDNVIEYLHRVGVMHLDFVLGTHAHSDHIGGMKFLAAALNAEGNYWIDSSTVYFYKQYYYNSLEEDDWEWQNTRMFRQAVEAMTERGAIMVETSSHDAQALEKANAVFIKGDSDPVSDSIAFTIGNLAVSLFNLYHNSSDNENLNSIVAAVTKDERTTLLMGYLEMEDGYERKVANTVAAKYGNADVIKLGHHGYDECTSSDTLRTLEPSYVVTTSNRTRNYYDDEPPFSYFLAHRGITAYRAAEATYALVEELSGEDIRFYTYDSSGGLTKDPVEWKARMTSGWKKWNRDDGTYDYIFVRSDGSAATGWNYLTMNGEASWYLFDQDGINLRGFQKDGQYTYYLNTKGEMQTGWQKVGGKWYYMNGSGAMVTGWQTIGGKRYYFNSSGVWVK